jgi:two-component system, OmpR family, osmolarity sensor histidine kinase EnvZ
LTGGRGAVSPPRRSPTLFWRTFLLVAALLVVSSLAWVQSIRVLERAPRAQQAAQQMISVINVTRTSLLFADPIARVALLNDLAASEGIRVVPLEPGDEITLFDDQPVVRAVEDRVRTALGAETRVAARVNGVPGFWVSFDIESDAYWLYVARDPLASDSGTAWLGWAGVAMLLSLVAAVAVTRAINTPLARLSRAAAQLGRGHVPRSLPETSNVWSRIAPCCWRASRTICVRR